MLLSRLVRAQERFAVAGITKPTKLCDVVKTHFNMGIIKPKLCMKQTDQSLGCWHLPSHIKMPSWKKVYAFWMKKPWLPVKCTLGVSSKKDNSRCTCIYSMSSATSQYIWVSPARKITLGVCILCHLQPVNSPAIERLQMT